MGLTKYAAFAIEAAELAPGAPARLRRMAATAVATKTGSRPSSVNCGWTKQAHRHAFQYTPRPGFLYVRSRAISSRINDNFDGFPAEEIKKAYATFKGKPVFVNHVNSNHRRARGVIIDAALHEDVNPDGSPDTWVEVLMEVDAVKFPKLAQAILAGHIDRTSMGTDVAYSICTFCHNKAATPLEYCAHIPKLKGKRIRRTTASGAKEDVLIAEMCYGLGFFENSLLVEDPADPTAYFLGVEGIGVTASRTAEIATVPIVETTEPPDVEPWDWKREKAEADRTGDWMELDEDFFAEGKLAAGPKLVPVERLQEGDVVNMGGSIGQWTVTRTEAIQYDLDGNPGTRVYFSERPQGMSFRNGHDTLSVVKPGRRGLTDAEMDERTPKRDPNASYQSQCPYCDKSVMVRNQRLPRHNWGSTPNVCETSGMTEEEAAALAERKRREWDERSRWGSMRTTAIGEVKAPPKVDTMADTTCPVCGEEDGYNGEECAVCGFVKPPDMFMDPDTDLAKQVDLRQEEQDAVQDLEDQQGTGDLVCDNCGTEFDDPDAQEAALPATSLDEDQVPPNKAQAPEIPEDKDKAKPGAPKDDEQEKLKTKPPVPQDPGEDPKKPEAEAVDGTDPTTDEKLQAPDADDEDASEAETVQPKAGDTCPDCGKGTLQKKSPEAVKPVEDGAAAPPGDQAAEAAEPDAEAEGDEAKDEDESGPPWMKRKKKKQQDNNGPKEGSKAMPRPWHVVAAEQQTIIDYNRQCIERIASVAGIDLSDLQHTATQRIASIRKRADEQNPTQPIPDPPAEAPSQTTQEAATPTATDDPTSVGASPLTNVAPDAQTSLADAGVVLDAPLDLNEQDPTRPVAGTEEVRPLNETRTEGEVRAGTPSDTGTMFPLQGDMANKPTLGAAQQGVPTPEERATARLFAGQRLARLRLQTGVEGGDEMVIAQRLASDRSLTDGAIMAEIETLTKVLAAPRQQGTTPVRAATGARRTVPSLVAGQQAQPGIAPNLDPATGGLTAVTGDEFLWEG